MPNDKCPRCGLVRKIKTRTYVTLEEERGKPKCKDPDEPMTRQQFFEGCMANKDRGVQIVGLLANTWEIENETRGQWSVFLKRHIKDARDLANFSDERIVAAVEKVREQGYITKWTGNTILQFIHEVQA